MATAARMPMIATTIISSIRVKPCCSFLMEILPWRVATRHCVHAGPCKRCAKQQLFHYISDLDVSGGAAAGHAPCQETDEIRQPLWLVAGDFRLVDVVDLLGIEEFARVLQVHLLAH